MTPSKFLLFPMLMLLITACGKREETVSEAPVKTIPASVTKTENGWPLYEVPAEGFALALPPDWQQFDMNPATFDATMRETLRNNPRLKVLFGNLRAQIKTGVKFFGVDEATIHSGFATNVNVLTVRSGGSLDATVVDTLKELGKQAVITKPITHERVPITDGEGERLKYRLTLKGPTGQPITLAITQFLATREAIGNVITLTTLPDQESKYSETFDKIGKSFRFMK